MHALAEEVLGTAGDAVLRPSDPLLATLLDAARAGDGEVQRLSERRVVLWVPHGGRRWLLKVDRPRRPLEALRARLRPPSGLREAVALRRLAERVPALAGPVHAEAPGQGASLFARHWWTGRPASELLPKRATEILTGLTLLHEAGWSDPDLLPGDLLLGQDGALRPVDLGGARERDQSTSASRRRVDLLLLLAGLPLAQAERTVAAAGLPDHERVLEAASALRDRRLHRQSARCLRRTRDFTPQSDGGIERTEGLPEGVLPLGIERFAKKEAAVFRFRFLYERELHDDAAPKVIRLKRAGKAWEVHANAPF